MRQLVAIDPSETVEVDFFAAAQARSIRLWREAAARAEAPGQEEALAFAQGQIGEAEAELARYAGDGPIFTLGLIPGEKRALILGLIQAAEEEKDRAQRAAAEHRWRREVIRWSVRGHRALRRANGSEAPFSSEEARSAGEAVLVPTEKQIEVYSASGLFGDLAALALDAQQLGGAEKKV